MLSLYSCLLVIFLSPNCIIATKTFSNASTLYESRKNGTFPRDSLHIVTPFIQISRQTGDKWFDAVADRVIMRDFIIDALRGQLPKATYYKLPFIYDNDLSINTVMERAIGQSRKVRDGSLAAPEQILISQHKYTVLVQVFGSLGDVTPVKRTTLNLTILNNYDKKIELTNQYLFDWSPIDQEFIGKAIKKAVNNIVDKLPDN